jgi:hypothetical protein
LLLPPSCRQQTLYKDHCALSAAATYVQVFLINRETTICGSVFLKKHAVLQLRRCQNTRRGRESSLRRVGGSSFEALQPLFSPASIQTCIVKRPVNTRLSGADSANTRPRLVVPPVAAGNTQLLFRPGGSETCRGFSSRYNIRSQARNSLPSQLLPSYLKVDS